jgi:pimeloyl-ACP methyl ester carboxylesterase
MTKNALRRAFEPQPVPTDYIHRAAIRLVLRPRTFYANARDLSLLENYTAAQVPRYGNLCTPTIIITGDRDTMVSPDINARVLAAAIPCAKLVLLRNVGHMPHHAAPEIVIASIDELVRGGSSRLSSTDLETQRPRLVPMQRVCESKTGPAPVLFDERQQLRKHA